MNYQKIFLSMCSVFIMLFYMSCETTSENIPTTFENVANYLQTGWDAYQLGNYPEAISNFNRAIEREAGNLDAHSGIAWSNFHLDNLDQAKAKFNFIISLATLKNDDAKLADGYAGLAVTGNKAQIKAIEDGKSDQDIMQLKLDEVIKNGNELLNVNPTYVHPYDGDIINAESILLTVADTYFSIHYFYDSVLKLDNISNTFLSDLLAALPNEAAVDTFMSANLDDNNEIFLDWSHNAVITLEEITATDGGTNPQSVSLIDGQDLKLPGDIDVFSENLVVQDSVISGDTLQIVLPSNDFVYRVVSAKDGDGFSVITQIPLDEDENPLGYIRVIGGKAGDGLTVQYRYNRKFSVSFKKTTNFYLYLDTIVNKLYQLKTS
jgi:tetratricopeptide (TPR) repeat protein